MNTSTFKADLNNLITDQCQATMMKKSTFCKTAIEE
jgi:hypothetical protein